MHLHQSWLHHAIKVTIEDLPEELAFEVMQCLSCEGHQHVGTG